MMRDLEYWQSMVGRTVERIGGLRGILITVLGCGGTIRLHLETLDGDGNWYTACPEYYEVLPEPSLNWEQDGF